MAAKKSPSTTKKTSSPKPAEYTPTSELNKPAPSPARKGVYALLALIVLLLIGAYVFKDRLIVVSVNGKYITRMAFIKELERQGGQQVLDQMVTEQLITAEAKKQGVSIPQDTIDTEIAALKTRLEGQGMNFDEALAKEGVTLTQLQKQISLQKLVEALTSDKTAVTDADVQKYLEENKDKLPEDNADSQELRTAIRDQLVQTKQQEVTQQWLEDLRSQAQIQYW